MGGLEPSDDTVNFADDITAIQTLTDRLKRILLREEGGLSGGTNKYILDQTNLSIYVLMKPMFWFRLWCGNNKIF